MKSHLLVVPEPFQSCIEMCLRMDTKLDAAARHTLVLAQQVADSPYLIELWYTKNPTATTIVNVNAGRQGRERGSTMWKLGDLFRPGA